MLGHGSMAKASEMHAGHFPVPEDVSCTFETRVDKLFSYVDLYNVNSCSAASQFPLDDRTEAHLATHAAV